MDIDEIMITEKKIGDLPFKTLEDQLTLLQTLFRYGHPYLPIKASNDVSTDVDDKMKKTLEQLQAHFKDTPSLVHWLNCALFKDDSCIPLALLFIEWYEQHPPESQNEKCNFREIYHFLYRLTKNQIPLNLSHNSAKVLYNIISEILHEICINSQHELLEYFTSMFQYRRAIERRVYPGKKKHHKEEQVETDIFKL